MRMFHVDNTSLSNIIRGRKAIYKVDPLSQLERPKITLNADDFGMSSAHNRAVIQAHRAGTIHSASLMIGEKASTEAIALAKETQSLPVGLHVALSDATPLLAANLIPSLVQTNGKFYPTNAALWRASLSRAGRFQIRSEIKAQLQAFFSTGLVCDHINTHRHSHQNPIIALILFQEARRYGIKRSRLTWDYSISVRSVGYYVKALRYFVVHSIMHLYGISAIYSCASRDTPGRGWTVEVLLDMINRRPSGLIELYFHPVDDSSHRYAIDLVTLLDPRVISALRPCGRNP